MTHPFDDWYDKYLPIRDGYQFDNYGDDFAFVQAQPDENVWTFSDESGSGTYLSAGLHYINSLGYYVTEKPWTNEHECIVLREAK
jgi:hypothetical protein